MARRFMRRARAPRQKVTWVSTLFNETALVIDASSSSQQVILDPVDWGGTVASVSKQGHVLRVVYNAVVMFVPLTTTDATEMVSLVWVIMAFDQDDLATNINITSAGSPIQEHRVIASGVEGMTVIETTGGPLVNFVPGVRIAVDTPSRIKMRAGDQLVAAYQFQSTAAATVSVAAVSAFSRVLIKEP